MRIAIVTFDGCNEIDSFVALNIFGRASPSLEARIASPTETVRSANGVLLQAQEPLEYANEADAVWVGSGRYTRQIVEDAGILSRLKWDARRQLLGSQCSGALLLAKLGLLREIPSCTDHMTRPHLQAMNVETLAKPFHCVGNVATAGGCLASHYLAAWFIARMVGVEAATAALDYVVPVGEEEAYISRAMGIVGYGSHPGIGR